MEIKNIKDKVTLLLPCYTSFWTTVGFTLGAIEITGASWYLVILHGIHAAVFNRAYYKVAAIRLQRDQKIHTIDTEPKPISPWSSYYEFSILKITPIAAVFNGYITLLAALNILNVKREQSWGYSLPIVVGTPLVGIARFIFYTSNKPKHVNQYIIQVGLLTSTLSSAIISFSFLSSEKLFMLSLKIIGASLIGLADFFSSRRRINSDVHNCNFLRSSAIDDTMPVFRRSNNDLKNYVIDGCNILKGIDLCSVVAASITWSHIIAFKLAFFFEMEVVCSLLVYAHFVFPFSILYYFYYMHIPDDVKVKEVIPTVQEDQEVVLEVVTPTDFISSEGCLNQYLTEKELEQDGFDAADELFSEADTCDCSTLASLSLVQDNQESVSPIPSPELP